jgi:hypothetical protein
VTESLVDVRLPRDLRDRLRAVADELIPAADGMPAASEVGVADAQLDRILAARPDLVEPLIAALTRRAEATTEWLSQLEAEDRAGYEAVLLTIVGGYYTDGDVRRRLGYRGQEPEPVRPEIIPDYAEDGLLDGVVERGPIYRAVPPDGPANNQGSV